MIRKVTLYPEIAGPLGLQPAVLDGLGSFVVIVGQNGSGKSRVLDAIRLMFDLAPRIDETRTVLSQRVAASEEPALREQLKGSLRVLDGFLLPEAILVDGGNGLRPPSLEDRCVTLTYQPETGAVAATFPDLLGPERGMSFTAAYRGAPGYLRNVATALFYGRHPEAVNRPDMREALREAERFNQIAQVLLGKQVSAEVSVGAGFEIEAWLGGRHFEPAALSAEEGMLLTWAILLHQQAPFLQDAVVMIDEPELHLHSTVVDRLLTSLRTAIGERGQLWIVTHSATIAGRSDATNLLLLENGAVHPLRMQPSLTDASALGLTVSKTPLSLPSLGASKAPVGTSDFRKIRTSDSLIYVDKTQFIEEVLRHPAEVLLFPRPRRFGKTLNLSALRFFVEKSPESQSRVGWFKDLRVWQSTEARKHFGRYPVIHLTFKEAMATSFPSLFRVVKLALSELYREHRYLLDDESLDSTERAAFDKILGAEGEPEDYWPALRTLSRHLERHHQQPVMILVDEYDTPLHAGYLHGYLDEATTFFRNFFSAGLKDNPHLFKGVLTGVLRIARESLFSGLNNIAVYSILRSEFATYFGFTESEVEKLCRQLGAPDLMSGLRNWYNGYLFGNEILFNPWSVMNCLASEDKRLASYWAETSSNELLHRQLFERGRGLGGELSTLLRGEPIRKPIDEDLVLRSLDTTPDALWSLLLFSGYLKPAEPLSAADRSLDLTIPNYEVRREFEKLVRQYFSRPVGGENNAERMLEALLRGDEKEFQSYLDQFLTYNMSPYDKDSRKPERVYHVFLLGMLVFLESRYEVKSNQIGGRARYDLMLIPKTEGNPGVCLELKRSKGNVDKELEQALRQIEDRRYTIELERRGARPIHKIAVVFDGERAWVRRVTEAPGR